MVQIERRDWIRVAQCLTSRSYWSGNSTVDPGYRWYLPAGGNVKVFEDLDIKPRSILTGEPIEHIRHFRVGGYELGTVGGGHGMEQHDGGRATT